MHTDATLLEELRLALARRRSCPASWRGRPRPRRPRARRPRAGRDPARRRQRRDQHRRPLRRRGLREAPPRAAAARRTSSSRSATGIGLHPSMRPAADLLESGRLAIVQGVGYPNPNRSHFESMAIWQTARLGPAARRPRRAGSAGPSTPHRPGDGPAAVHVGDQSLPLALVARRAVEHVVRRRLRPVACRCPPGSRHGQATEPVSSPTTWRPSSTGPSRVRTPRPPSSRPPRREAADGSARYPETELAKRLRAGRPVDQVRARRRGSTTLIQPGYDSHAVQLPAHAQLLRRALRRHARRSSTISPRRSWPTACSSWPSASSAAGPRRTARSAPTTAPPARSSSPARACKAGLHRQDAAARRPARTAT